MASIEPAPDPRAGLTLIGLVVEGSTLLVATLIVAAVVVDALRLPVHTLRVAPAALLLAAPVLVVSWHQRRGWPSKIDWQTDLMLLCAGGAVAWRLFSST
ncbi:MAG: hypothetical protein M3380_16225, partial [Chloroflexota bacterium]|nr:hypothetical protein [Chloroflexota bacterium]